MQVSKIIESFLNWQRRNNTENTVRYYELALRWLDEFANREWESLKREELIPALDKCNLRPDGRPWKNDTIRRNITGVTQLQKHAEDLYELGPVLRPKDLKKPPGTQRERIPTLEELAAIMDAAPPALELAFRSLAQSGMRPNELAGATISDLSEAHDLLVLKKHKTARKTGKPRRIPLGNKMQEFVSQAIGDRQTGNIWVDENGKPWTVQKLSASFRRIRDQLGFSGLVLYSFRHWKGSEVAKTHGIYAAKTILGHTQISTTQRYAHPDDESAREWQD